MYSNIKKKNILHKSFWMSLSLCVRLLLCSQPASRSAFHIQIYWFRLFMWMRCLIYFFIPLAYCIILGVQINIRFVSANLSPFVLRAHTNIFHFVLIRSFQICFFFLSCIQNLFYMRGIIMHFKEILHLCVCVCIENELNLHKLLRSLCGAGSGDLLVTLKWGHKAAGILS